MNAASNMKALVLNAPGSLVLGEVAMPEPGDGEVLVQVKACGVCGSDLPRIFGGEAYHYPLIPGHEFSGIVLGAGSPGDERWVGKRVTVYPLIPCRQCPQCELAQFELCENYGYLGSRQDGGFAQYVTVPAANCIELPDHITFDLGALSEPAAVTWHALQRSMMVPGDRVVVFGLGPIGMLFGCWAKLAGCSTLIGVDIDREKFFLAATLGFDELVHPEDGHLLERIHFATGIRGANLVVEASGTGIALREALKLVARRGNLLMLGNQGKEVTLDPEDCSRILRKEIRVHGTWNSSFNRLVSDWADILLYQGAGRVSLAPLISHRFTLEEGVEALSAMHRRAFSFTKVIISPPGP